MRRKNGLMFAILTLMVVGFAAVSSSLFFNGSTIVSTNNSEFEVYYSNAIVNGVEDKSVIVDDTHIEFEAEMKNIGDEYELEYFITNGSRNYDADVSMNCTSGNDYVTVTNNWVNHTIINSTNTASGTLSLEMIKGYVGDEPLELAIECEINTVAAERDTLGTGTPAEKVEQGIEQISFAVDSWDTIQKAVQSGNYIYQVGDTKTITIAAHTNDCASTTGYGSEGDYTCIPSEEPEKQVTVRVANTSDCTNGETSETACGFVVEFVDVIDKHNYNDASTDSDKWYGTNVGGWRDSKLRSYISGTIFNALPIELQEVIADTTVVSGHGSTSGETDFVTTDKLYLLSPNETDLSSTYYRHDTSEGTSRTLDYYSNYTHSYPETYTIKYYNESVTGWWLRSAFDSMNNYFFAVGTDGDAYGQYTHEAKFGISPAFRIV